MERWLELFEDSYVVELEDIQVTQVLNIGGNIKALFEFLKFTRATAYSIADAQGHPMEMPQPRGCRQINAAGVKQLDSDGKVGAMPRTAPGL